ncbi:MAG TPA: MraY family glycosyltransferase [Tepidisphaeraceae bacterium]|jgi:UDP-GlcNAc:undecaprenyl-phosphate GlcNAc-1-phosphate transferase|nr:MraY family glycosyltransferase [Tepidisphaeraceae bacterium]
MAVVISCLLASFLLSLGLTAVIRKLALRVGFVDKPGHRKIHYIPKPLGGGVAILLAMAIPMVGGLAYVHFSDPPKITTTTIASYSSGNVHSTTVTTAIEDHPLAVHWPGIRHQTPLALKFLAAMLAMHLLGLWDDRKALGPYLKLLIQLAIITALVLWADLRALTVLDKFGVGKWPSVILTVLWIAGITNAFNFLDNMDGLSAGVAAVCAGAFLLTVLTMPEPRQLFVAVMLGLFIGALLGFLIFNFAPASIFMGDSGSLLIGLVLGVLTIRTTYLPPSDQSNLGARWYALLAPLVVLAVPLYDLIVVSFIRLRMGKSPFVGDTNHFSHRLVARGMSRRTAVLCIYLITAATSLAAVLLPHVRTSLQACLIFGQTILVLGVVMLLEQHPLPAYANNLPTPQPKTLEPEKVELKR